ncbi:MAG: UpxY family transcription antiterminator [Bacteroidales bacterium]|nr:UpxY family transcription antiterminator [Bacteroidales bacterium]
MEPVWYALKVFFNRVPSLRSICTDASWQTYVPMKVEEVMSGGSVRYVEKQLIPSLLFVKCTADWLKEQRREDRVPFMVYHRAESYEPRAIPELEMQMFMMVTSTRDRDLLFLGGDKALWHQGDRVRVTDGVFKGAEGIVKRIKKDRRLIVTVNGVAAVATSYIHPSFLEKI